MKSAKLVPVARWLDGHRIDLKAARAKKFAVKTRVPPKTDTEAMAKRLAAKREATRLEKKRERALRMADGGKDGAVTTNVRLQISGQRSAVQEMRSRPGTFEWRFGRDKQDHLFHAGSHLAQLWERAGITIASSADFLRGIASGYKQGISDGRVEAMDQLSSIMESLNHGRSERLIDYCVAGLTSAEVALKHGIRDRDVAAVLHQDLRDCWEIVYGTGKQARRSR